MPDLTGQKMVLAVAQLPFEVPANDGGPVFTFGTLVPLILEDASLAEPEDFPNNGLVWWMLRPGALAFAEPGRLVAGVLEPAQRQESDNPDKAVYQINRESVEPVKEDDLVEILTISTPAVRSPRDLLSGQQLISLDHPPASTVLVRWNGFLYGPLRASSTPARSSNEYGVAFVKMSPDQSVLKIPDASLLEVPSHLLCRLKARVSLDRRAFARAYRTAECEYEILLGGAVDAVLERASEGLDLETNVDVLRRVAKRLLTRKKKQEFRRLLDDLGEAVNTTGKVEGEEGEVLTAVLAAVKQDEEEARRLSQSLLESGSLDTQIDTGIRERFDSFVKENATRLQAEIEERVETSRTKLERLETEVERLERELESKARKAGSDLEHELERRRTEAEQQIHDERTQLEQQRLELDTQRQVVSQNLATVTERFATARDEVVNEFLALSPLLQQMGIIPERGFEAGPRQTEAPLPVRDQPEFVLPSFVMRDVVGSAESEIGEREFFERFTRHVAASGFVYRDLDLVSFHLSTKCSDMTVLGGLSGTGKSSLPRLYAEALEGSEALQTQRYLQVGVSPSWLDVRDLLGHLNALERRFEPAASGLYQHLVFAQEEYRRHGQGAGLYVICLDEMNLSHVEHYFSAFLQALERPLGLRTVQCFVPQNVDPASPFARWPSLELPRSVRFAGTVNLDETTRQLSLRLLDRTNFIRLRPGKLPDIPFDVRQDSPTRPDGPPITLGLYRSWCRTARLSKEFAGIVDQIRPHLYALGCPLNPRRYRAICEFVASAPSEICSPAEALDLQFAQRLLPQIRSVFRREAREAVDAIAKVLEAHGADFPESLGTLQDLRDSEYEGVLTPDE